MTGRARVAVAALAAMCLISACDSPTGPGTSVVDQYRADGMVFTASAVGAGGGKVQVSVTVTNETDFRAQTGILGGNCMLRARFYKSRDGDLEWSAWDHIEGCQEPLRIFDLEGGDSETVSEFVTVHIDKGEHFATVTIEHGGQLVELAAGTFTLR